MKFLFVVLSIGFFVSCGQQAETTTPGKTIVAEKTVAPEKVVVPEVEKSEPVVGEVVQDEALLQIQAILAKADQLDGTEDHIVTKCAGCMLNMEGSAENKHEMAGYELHHCSEGCKTTFLEEPNSKILALQARLNK